MPRLGIPRFQMRRWVTVAFGQQHQCHLFNFDWGQCLSIHQLQHNILGPEAILKLLFRNERF